MAATEVLEAEARRIGHYLVGVDVSETLVERYREANHILFPDRPSPTDAAVLEFVRRHPWSLPPLESALGLIRPGALLRRKLVVMTAILETDPRFADSFGALEPGRSGAILRLLGLGLSSTVKVAGGFLLYPFAKLLGGRGVESHGRP